MSATPRRFQMDRITPAEQAIYDAIEAVEQLPADERLTRAEVLLLAARDAVADYVDVLDEPTPVEEEPLLCGYPSAQDTLGGPHVDYCDHPVPCQIHTVAPEPEGWAPFKLPDVDAVVGFVVDAINVHSRSPEPSEVERLREVADEIEAFTDPCDPPPSYLRLQRWRSTLLFVCAPTPEDAPTCACGHPESDHVDHGACRGTNEEIGWQCWCTEFRAAPSTEDEPDEGER